MGATMTLTSEITGERPPHVVWAYFTQPGNWRRWSCVSLESARREVGGRMRFEKNMVSIVEATEDFRAAAAAQGNPAIGEESADQR